MKPKKIIKGTRVKLSGKIPGMDGWWIVDKRDGDSLTISRKTKGTKGSKDESWTTVDQVTKYSNTKRKGKIK